MTDLTFALRNHDWGYVGRQLWLPKKHINVRSLKAGLEFPVMDDLGISYLQLWEDVGTHLVVPREFIPRRDYPSLNFPIYSVGPTDFKKVRFESRVVLDKREPHKDTQRQAFAVMMGNHSGILNLACLSGNTEIRINRGKKGFKVKLSDAFRRFNGLADNHNWDPSIDTFIRSNQNGVIGLQRVEAIVYKGKRQTYCLKLVDDKELYLTEDHEVLTTAGSSGFMTLRELERSQASVITDGEREESMRKPKPHYKRLSWYPCHPYVRKQERVGRAPSYVIEEHRAVAECVLNGFRSLKEYRERLKTGNIDGLKFIDPERFHVHHIDEDTQHNHPDNLEILDRETHLEQHRPGAKAFGYGIPTPVKVKSIIPYMIEDVYDVVCASPHHNFVANGIVVHNCGKGKTCIALHHIAIKGVPALVIVNNTTLINQWVDRIHEHLGYVEGGVGIIQGPPKTWDWEGRGIVIAMIHSLSLRVPEIPVGLDRYFGGIYYDEVHHLSAPLFSQTAPLFYGERHGLTATEKREDGLEMIYQYHIGSVYHSDLFQDLKPRVYFQEVPVKLDMSSSEVKEAVNDKRGMLSIPKLRSYLGSLPEANEFIAEKLQKPLLAGRKILVLSHSVDQLRNLNMMFEDSGLCTGSEPPKERIRTLQSKQITFGTLQLVKEALDEASLDTLFILTPFGSQHVDDGGLNTLQQGMGRLQRPRPGKKTPVVVILDYIYIPKFHRMANRLKTLVRRWPKEQGGPLEYVTVRPYQED